MAKWKNQREFQEQDKDRKLREDLQLEIIELGKLGAFKDEVGVKALSDLEYADLSQYGCIKTSELVDMFLISATVKS